jgi:hypothetical protein
MKTKSEGAYHGVSPGKVDDHRHIIAELTMPDQDTGGKEDCVPVAKKVEFTGCQKIVGRLFGSARHQIRQTLTAFRTWKCLRIRSSKPFAENTFRAFKGLWQRCRYG